MLSAGLVLAAASCTDYSDYNTVPADALTPGANQTLWENISSDPQLTKFKALAEKSKFSATLNSPRFFTLWAPVDGAFDEVEFSRLMASDSATIVKEFMHQHMANYNHPVSAALDSMTIISLNAKHHPFTQSYFDGFSYNSVNVPATNGLMHKINGMSEYFLNHFENIDQLEGCDSIKNYIQQFNDSVLDTNASVIGPLVNGQQTYEDSVMLKTNSVISNILRADLENEDSTYCMFIPNDDAWHDAYEKINPYYNYIDKLDYMDLSLKSSVASSTNATTAKATTPATPPSGKSAAEFQDSLTIHNVISNLVFSGSYQRNQPMFGLGAYEDTDSAYSTNRRYLTGMQQMLDHTIDIAEMSNGVARIVDTLAYAPEETFNPVLSASYPSQTLKVKKLSSHSIHSPSNVPLQDFPIFSKVPKMIKQWLFPVNSPYFTYVAVDSTDVDGSSAKPEFNFALRNVRSTTYHIYVVTVPAQIDPDAVHLVRPYYLRFYLSYTDASNKQQYIVLPEGAKASSAISTDNQPEKPESNTVYVGDPDKVNVIDLGEFTFPVCYYGTDAYPSLMMMHTKNYTSATLRNRYDQQLRVAGVFLVPKDYNDKWANSDNE